MKVIIVGCGKVGYTIARNLSAEKNVDITMIDNFSDALEKAVESIDIMHLSGNGLSANILIEAGARDADLIICVTEADATNILCCISAKHLGTKHTIARVRDPEYALDLNKLWKELGIDMIINPELEAAREISRLLRFPTVDNIDTFVNGRIELVSFKVSEAPDFFVGKSVAQAFYKTNTKILLAVVERDGAALIPKGDLVFEEDDTIRVIGQPNGITDFFDFVGIKISKIRDISVVGGGRITRYLASILDKHHFKTTLKIIEKDKAHGEFLYEAVSELHNRCLIIHGDGTDEELLISESIDKSDAIVSLTDRDEENIMISLYSLQMGIKKIITKINHANLHMVKKLGVGSVVCPKNITSNHIVRFVRALNNASNNHVIKTIYKIFENGDEFVEAMEFTVHGEAKALNVPLKNLKLKKGVLLGCIVRNNSIIIPSGDTEISEGDTVIVIMKNGNISEIDDILEGAIF